MNSDQEELKRLSPVKYAITSSILDKVVELGGGVRDTSIVQAYLVEALNVMVSLGDIKVLFPEGTTKLVGFSHAVEKSIPTVDSNVALCIRDRHREAFGLIQQCLLLKMIED
ncbi:hypothetical protein VPMG_00106 [Vibrio phage VBP32]|uniref:Uncharacterized protein n=2 Tax=Stoningtonvirus VBP47 TaxID=2846606 RepID=M4SL29_9CAUD|nr:hypothetical protein VPNG_00023 [Vibrio phage VBP47]YP_007676596.1 hypothetical protein VPMG_00106 [Vibrio phage VBP32]AGH57047.1 hypothetical protein VPNG_00023 [Vibrio phage VBP47]AGH57245.1 hypothetical protein VPMG_00106 [Vibrio phage VBP32]